LVLLLFFSLFVGAGVQARSSQCKLAVVNEFLAHKGEKDLSHAPPPTPHFFCACFQTLKKTQPYVFLLLCDSHHHQTPWSPPFFFIFLGIEVHTTCHELQRGCHIVLTIAVVAIQQKNAIAKKLQ
jgi:hypothetical protein